MNQKKPKGVLIPIGGAEDREHEKNILKRVIKETGKRKPVIGLITLATDDNQDQYKTYKTAFKPLGISHIDNIHYSTRNEADTEAHLDIIRQADLIYIGGGDQLRLSGLLGGTEMLKLMHEKYYTEEKFVIAGTSAGAAAMSHTMITGGEADAALIRGELQLTNGMDFLNNVLIDTHNTERGRIGRLIQAAAANPGILGIGLGANTGLVIKKGMAEVIGDGLAMIIDGSKITYSDLAEIEDGDPITVENMVMHVLSKGKLFSLEDRRIPDLCKKTKSEK